MKKHGVLKIRIAAKFMRLVLNLPSAVCNNYKKIIFNEDDAISVYIDCFEGLVVNNNFNNNSNQHLTACQFEFRL